MSMIWWWAQGRGRVTPIPPVILSRVPVGSAVFSMNATAVGMVEILVPISYVVDVDVISETITTASPYFSTTAENEPIRIL